MNKQKRMWLAATTSLVAFTSALQAADNSNLEKRISTLEARKGSSGVITPNVNPRTRDGLNLSIEGTALLMQAREDFLEYAANALPTGDAGYSHPSSRWNWGFRVGMGYTIPNADAWDLKATWMRIHNDAKGNAGGTVFPTKLIDGLGGFGASTTTANWQARINILDFDLGRDFYFSKWLTFNPFLGMRSAWIRQTYQINYVGTNTNILADHWNYFWGLGMHTGANLGFGLGGGFSVFGNFAYSLVYGNFEVNDASNNYGYQVINEVRNMKAIYDFAAGLRYRSNFADDAFAVQIDAAWERIQYPGQNQMREWPNPSGAAVGDMSNGDLGQRGWSLKIRFDF